ncbi:MAG: hypothetical protein ISS70_22455 [Phycisphaerae bacterium]|nr:hypothetical protein [Phycisphaerae bacterium]
MIGETSLLMVLVAIGSTVPAMKDVTVTQSGDEITIGNEFLSRTYDISGGKVQTIRVENKRSGRMVSPNNSPDNPESGDAVPDLLDEALFKAIWRDARRKTPADCGRRGRP